MSEECKLKQIHKTNKEKRDALKKRGEDIGKLIREKEKRYMLAFILEYPEHKGQKDLVKRVANGRTANEIIITKLENFYIKLKNL